MQTHRANRAAFDRWKIMYVLRCTLYRSAPLTSVPAPACLSMRQTAS